MVSRQESMTHAQKLCVGFAILAILGALAVGIYGRSRVGEPTDGDVYVEPPTGLTQPQIQVHVTGAVHSPDVYILPADSRGWQAVRAAGGLLDVADEDAVNLAAPLADGDRIEIPSVAPTRAHAATVQMVPQGGLIDINRAPVERLETLPGIGEELAGRIVAHRTKYGPFGKVEGLVEVSGIGEAKLRAIRDLVTVQAYANP